MSSVSALRRRQTNGKAYIMVYENENEVVVQNVHVDKRVLSGALRVCLVLAAYDCCQG